MRGNCDPTTEFEGKMTECSLLVEHSIRYTNGQPLAVRDVIESLKGLEKVSVYFLPGALSSLTGADVVTAELLVEGFDHGSFVQDVIVKLFFRDQAGMDRFLDKVREGGKNVYRKLPGEGAPVLKATVAVGCVLGALVTVGAIWAISTKQAAPATTTITITDSNFVAIGAEAYQMSPQAFADLIEAIGSTDKKKLAQSAAKILAPAKREEGAVVEMDGNSDLVVPSTTIMEVPETVDFEPYEIEQAHSDVDLEIRATDRDSQNRGWAGVITGIVDRRAKLSFADGVNPESIAGRLKVRADVVVTMRMSPRSKKMEPVAITITELIPD